MSPFVKSFQKVFRKVLLSNFSYYLNNLLKHCVSAKFLLMESYVQGDLRKELLIALSAERFKITTFGRSN